MPTKIVIRPQGINESNLLKVVEEDHCGTIAPEHHILIAKISDRTKFGVFLRLYDEKLKDLEQRNNTNLNNVSYALVSSTHWNLRNAIRSPFLTRHALRRNGIEPIVSYGVKRDCNSFRKIRQY